MQGQYVLQRKVKDLPEGYEFESNRFVTDKNQNGCRVTYLSQDGTIKYLMISGSTSTKKWLGADEVINCMVDFVPDEAREYWSELQKLGKCYVHYYPDSDSWRVLFPENESLNKLLTMCRAESNLAAIEDAIDRLCFQVRIVNNGNRWFDCRDSLNIKKISDSEANKLIEDLHE